MLFTIRSRRTGFIRGDWSSARYGEPFFDASGVLGGLRPALSVSLYSLFIVVSFLLNGTPRVGTCPISPSLQLLVVVVRTEKYGRVRRMALNAIMAAFPLNTFVVLSCFSTLPAPWMIESVIAGGRSLLPSSATMCGGGLSPWLRKGFFPWAGPLDQYKPRHRPTGLLPSLTIAPQNPAVQILGRRGGFW